MPTNDQKIRARGCRHFNGLVNARCGVGMKYKTMMKDGQLPCRPSGLDGQYHGSCLLFEAYTIEEIDKIEAESAAALKRFMDNLAQNLCPECHNYIVGRRQVGRCVYALPCNHRLYQGTIDGSPLEGDE